MTASTRGPLARRLGLVLCLALTLACGPASLASAALTDYGLETVDASRQTSQAGAHGDLGTFFELKTDPTTPADVKGLHSLYARTKNISIELPPGFSGNPNAVPACTNVEFSAFTTNIFESCPQDAQVGVVRIGLKNFQTVLVAPLFNMESSGDSVARLGYYSATTPNFINIEVRPEDDYAVTAKAEGIASNEETIFADAELWAVPADSSHDTLRILPRETFPGNQSSSPPRPSGLDPVAFLTNPTNCIDDQEVTFSVESYQVPGLISSLSDVLGPATACDLVPFEPEISFAPTTRRADSPSGLDVTLSVDQTELLEPDGIAPAHLKKAVVRLPQGLSVNPASAHGLDGCSTDEIGLVSKNPLRFDSSPPRCPDASKIGTAEITTPVLDEPLSGAMYLADQTDNPFDTLLSGYLVAQGQGVLIKLAGRFEVSPSGQITAIFDNNPQQPFSGVELHFKGGDRGVLITPPACGTYEITTELVPWSADDPENPTAQEIVTRASEFTIDSGPGGGPCPSGEFEPGFEAGTTIPLAGQFSPFSLRLTRQDGTERLVGVSTTLPPGLTAKLAGIPYCPEAAIAAAKARNGLGQGALELQSPSCPQASQVAKVIGGAGAGPTPFFIETGKAYLAGPYGGAPLSLLAVVPAVAGPFDLGAVVERVALHVDPRSAQVSAVSDSLPLSLHGIPLDVREVRVIADRSEFTLNPTSCEPMRIAASLTSEQGKAANSGSRFQVGGCRALGFAPKLSFRLFGGTHRGAFPKLQAVLRAREGNANIAGASVALPRSEFIEQGHMNNICTRVQFAAKECPEGSVYGHAVAVTPLFDQPLSGPVYLRSSSHKLPDLVAVLRGPDTQPVEVDLVGRIDSVKGGIRNRFEVVPDAPVQTFKLTMQGGKKSLLVNSTNICRGIHKANARFTAQNGRILVLHPALRAAGCGKSRKRR